MEYLQLAIYGIVSQVYPENPRAPWYLNCLYYTTLPIHINDSNSIYWLLIFFFSTSLDGYNVIRFLHWRHRSLQPNYLSVIYRRDHRSKECTTRSTRTWRCFVRLELLSESVAKSVFGYIVPKLQYSRPWCYRCLATIRVYGPLVPPNPRTSRKRHRQIPSYSYHAFISIAWWTQTQVSTLPAIHYSSQNTMAANHVGSPRRVLEPIPTEAGVTSWCHQSSLEYAHMVRCAI